MFQIMKRYTGLVTEKVDMTKFIGRQIWVKDDNGQKIRVEIENCDSVQGVPGIQGNLRNPTKFQINARGKAYLISMLDFFAQVNEEKISDEEIKAFDDTIFAISKTLNERPFLHTPTPKKGKKKLWTPS